MSRHTGYSTGALEPENPDDLLGEVVLSRTYTVVLERGWIGRMRALRLKVRHEGADGVVSYRGGFLVMAEKLGEVIDAMRAAQAVLGGGS